MPCSVLTLVRSLDLGGTQRAAQNFARSYAELGLDSRVWCIDEGGLRAQELEMDGVAVAQGNQLRRRFGSWKADLIHVHSHGVHANIVSRLANSGHGPRIVDTNVFSTPTSFDSRLHVDFQLSHVARERYWRNGGQVPSAVVPNPIAIDPFFRDGSAAEDFRRRHRIPQTALVVGRVGQPIHAKWAPLTLDAFESLATRRGDAWLLVVGAPALFARDTARSRFSDRIVMVDRVEGDSELRAAYSAMDIFLHTASLGESFGYVLVESMLCETPVLTISSPWRDNSQGSVVGEGGIVVHRPDEILQALQELSENEDRRELLGKRGRRSVIQRFNSATVAAEALQLASIDHPTLDDRIAVPLSPPDGRALLVDRLRGQVGASIAFGSWRWAPQLLASKYKRGPR